MFSFVKFSQFCSSSRGSHVSNTKYALPEMSRSWKHQSSSFSQIPAFPARALSPMVFIWFNLIHYINLIDFNFLTHAFCFPCWLFQAKDLFQHTDLLTFSNMPSLCSPVHLFQACLHPWIFFWYTTVQCEQNLKYLNWVTRLKKIRRSQQKPKTSNKHPKTNKTTKAQTNQSNPNNNTTTKKHQTKPEPTKNQKQNKTKKPQKPKHQKDMEDD